MTLAWIVGVNGLLGSALKRTLLRRGVKLFVPEYRFNWNNQDEVINQLECAANSFITAARNDIKWQIYWAAGIGTMGSQEAELSLETSAMTQLLTQIESHRSLVTSTGSISFASSAGGIYAGTRDHVVTEDTETSPTTAYALEKLKQEDLLRGFAHSNPQTTVLIARITTLYGAGQSHGKNQGLLTTVARRILRNQPIQIFVPFDTIRDYVHADDAALSMVTATDALSDMPGVFVKIVASEQPITIAAIMSMYRKISRRTPRVVVKSINLSNLYPKRIQFRSIVAFSKERTMKTSLHVGISQIMAAERLALSKSRL